MAEPPDDMIAINAVLDGDPRAFETLLERYGPLVAKVAKAHVPGEHVEEVAHETFVRAYRSLHRYRPVKPFGNWLTTLATRSCHDFWRKRYRRKEAPVCDLSDDAQAFVDAALAAESWERFEELARRDEARELLDAVLCRLSATDRMVLTLAYLEERSMRETAERLGLSVTNVKVRAFRAKRKLRGFLATLMQPRREA